MKIEHKATIAHLAEWKALAATMAARPWEGLSALGHGESNLWRFNEAAREGWPATIALAEKLMEDSAVQRNRIEFLEKQAEKGAQDGTAR